MHSALQNIITKFLQAGSIPEYRLSIEQCCTTTQNPAFQAFNVNEKSAIYYMKTYAYLYLWDQYKMLQGNEAALPFIEEARTAILQIDSKFDFKAFQLPELSPEKLYSLVAYTENVQNQVFHADIYEVIRQNHHLLRSLKINDTLYKDLEQKYSKQSSVANSSLSPDSTAQMLGLMDSTSGGSAILTSEIPRPATTQPNKKITKPLLVDSPENLEKVFAVTKPQKRKKCTCCTIL
jgi:hypothetical protein